MAALALWVAYRVDWNPWPAVGVVGFAALALRLPYRSIAEGIMAPRIPDPIAYIKERVGVTGDVFDELHRRFMGPEKKGYYEIENLWKHAEQVRHLYFPLDGSDKHPDFQRDFQPMRMPIWWRLLFLPDLVGINQGMRRWSFDRSWLFGQVHDFYKHGSVDYSSYNTAPELMRWVKAYPQIRELLGFDVYFSMGGGTDTNDRKYWGLHLNFKPSNPEHKPGQLSRWHSDSEMAIQGEEEQAVTADALPYEPLQFIHAPNPDGHLHDGWLYFGEQFLDRKAGGHYLKIDSMTHFLVMGSSGFGKSVFLNQILQGVRHNIHRFEKVYLIDLKGGVELWKYQKLGEQYKVVYKFDELAPLIAELVALIEARFEEMRLNEWANWPGKKYFLVIDEYAQIQLSAEYSKEERQRKQELLANLNKISTLGRAAGVLIWAQLQKGTSDVMDSSFRANLASQVCFKVPNKLTAASMFGDTSELMVDPTRLQKGRFILFDASMAETYYLQARIQP